MSLPHELDLMDNLVAGKMSEDKIKAVITLLTDETSNYNLGNKILIFHVFLCFSFNFSASKRKNGVELYGARHRLL